ncbi:MAG TPA: class B sortase [Candidatus Dorea intestinavium]|nr:class B sortase [Candidatus Dorea intestinavium]
MKQKREKKRRKKSGWFSNLILIIALVVFCVAGFQLFQIGKGYVAGRSEYKKITKLAITGEAKEEQFQVNFAELLKINPDTVGWLRFFPQPEIINYPIVHTNNNDTYLTKTFSQNENTVGAIFLNAYNQSLEDKHCIIYGHYMNDGSMFHKLWDYEKKEFYDANPNFYIYTPDGKEKTYRIFSVARVDENDLTYGIQFDTPEDFDTFIKHNQEVSIYDTGVEVKNTDQVVSLSTCTSLNDSTDRWKIAGVLIETKEINKE